MHTTTRRSRTGAVPPPPLPQLPPEGTTMMMMIADEDAEAEAAMWLSLAGDSPLPEDAGGPPPPPPPQLQQWQPQQQHQQPPPAAGPSNPPPPPLQRPPPPPPKPPPMPTTKRQLQRQQQQSAPSTTVGAPRCMTERRRLVLRELERQADQLSAALAVEQARNTRLRRECAAHAHMADGMASLMWTPLQKRRFASPSTSRAPSSSRALSSSAMAVACLDATVDGAADAQGVDADGAESAAAAATNQGVYGVPAFANALHKSFRRLRAAAERVCGGVGGSKGRGGAASVAAAAAAAAAAADALAAKVDTLFLDGPAPADASDDGPPRLIFLHDERDRRIFEDSAAGEMSRMGSGVIAAGKAGAPGEVGGGRSGGGDDGGGESSGDDDGGGGGLQAAAAAAVAAPASASAARGATATANAAGTTAVNSGVGGRSRSVGGRASVATPAAAAAAASLGWEERCIRAKNMSIRAACEVMVGINARISLAMHQLAEERAWAEEAEEDEEEGGDGLQQQQQQGDNSGDANDPTPADAARAELRAAALDWSTWNGAIFHANEILAEWLCECNLLKRAPDAALSDDVAGTRRRALKALASAKPSREQVELLADAHMLFRKASAPGLEAWRAAADELNQMMEGGACGQLEAAIDRLEKAVADTAAARGAMSVVVFRVLRLEQISLVALGFFPCTLRVSPLTEAAWTMARQNGWGVMD